MKTFFKYLILSLVAFSVFTACDEKRGGGGAGGQGDDPAPRDLNDDKTEVSVVAPQAGRVFTQNLFLSDFVNLVAKPAYHNLKNEVSALKLSIDENCNAEKLDYEPIKKQWQKAMFAYNFTESFHSGPITLDSNKLANDIYHKNGTSHCRVDKEVVAAYKNPDYVMKRNDNRKGLGAIEYLLYDSDFIPQCANPSADIESWANLDIAERKLSRCAYMSKVAEELLVAANAVHNSWDKQNYGSELLALQHHSSNKEAINEISDTVIVFMDKTLKDNRLGSPLDINNKNGFRPKAIEHRISGFSIESMRASLIGFKSVIVGEPLFLDNYTPNGHGLGFLAYIRSMGLGSEAETLLVKINEAIAILEELPAGYNFRQEIETIDYNACLTAIQTESGPKICVAFKKIKNITDYLKLEFLTALGLDLPEDAGGDTD